MYNHIKRLYLPYTVIDVGFWHQGSFPTSLPSGRFDYAAMMPSNEFHGDGEQPNIIGDLRDLGRWTAKIIEDERTLNKYVFTCSDVLSENQIYSIVEELTGEKLERSQVRLHSVHTLGTQLTVMAHQDFIRRNRGESKGGQDQQREGTRQCHESGYAFQGGL